VLFLDYDKFRAAPAASLERVLAHSRLPRSLHHCQEALDEVCKERVDFRYSKGVSGRVRAVHRVADGPRAPDDGLLRQLGTPAGCLIPD
jgi:hypothetical protein